MAPHVSALVVLAGLSLRATTTDTLQSNVQQETSITTKCSQLDADLPLNLGVSAAILESVIFCHQEDSFWPLSEPSVLKKKFDDIFAATRWGLFCKDVLFPIY